MQLFSLSFFFRSAFLYYLFEFNRNSMDAKETVERSRDSMNPTEICCECDCVILVRVFFLLIYLEIYMHEYLVWVALPSHVTQYNIHLIWSIRTDHTQRGVSICFFLAYLFYHIWFSWSGNAIGNGRVFFPFLVSFHFYSARDYLHNAWPIFPNFSFIEPIFILNLSTATMNEALRPAQNLSNKISK